jgi:hypothetical protein
VVSASCKGGWETEFKSKFTKKKQLILLNASSLCSRKPVVILEMRVRGHSMVK